MDQFFGSMYCWFENFFSIELADYLWGNSSPYQTTNMFISIGLSMFVISLFMMICFYYIINHPRMNNWWSWGIFLIINGVINFLVGWRWVLADFYEGIMVGVDQATNQEVPLEIYERNILCFGVSNMILSMLAFFVFSYLFKWWSVNAGKAPF